MHGEEDDVVLMCDADEGCAQERVRERDRRGARPRGARGETALPRGRRAVWVRSTSARSMARRRGDACEGRPSSGGKRGAQDFVALDDLAEAVLGGRRVERSHDAHGGGDVVGGAVRFELIEEPEPLLGEGEGELSIAGDGGDGRGRGFVTGADRASRGGRRGRRRWGPRRGCGEGRSSWKSLGDAGHDLGSEQGMAAEGEEVVVPADAGEVENLLPDSGDDFLDRGGGRRRTRLRALRRGDRERAGACGRPCRSGYGAGSRAGGGCRGPCSRAAFHGGRRGARRR